MYRMSHLVGKQLINQATGEKTGTVRDVVFDSAMRHVAALLVRDGVFGTDQVIRWNAVVSMGDVFVVQLDSALQALREDSEIDQLYKQAVVVNGTRVLSATGEQIGTSSDIFIDAQGAVVGYEVRQSLLQGDKLLPAEAVQAVGKDAIIATTTDLRSVRETESAA